MLLRNCSKGLGYGPGLSQELVFHESECSDRLDCTHLCSVISHPSPEPSWEGTIYLSVYSHFFFFLSAGSHTY
jgi:hypothetical protein